MGSYKNFRYGSSLSKNRILLFSDNVITSRIMGKVLKRRKYIMIKVKDPAYILNDLIEYSPRLAILDYNGPHFNSLSLCKTIKTDRRTAHIPLIILSYKDAKRDIINGLEAGADDYITRPFDIELFLARLKVILQRRLYQEEPDEILKSRDIVVNLTAYTVNVKNKPVKLAPKEFALLYFLMKRKGKLLSRRTLIENIWEHKYFGNMRTVDVHVQSLRKKLGSTCVNCIEAVEGMGYRLRE